MSTLFTKIIQWDIPSYKLYEDDKVYVCLDINQFHVGNTLIIPKLEVDHLFDLPDDYYQAMFHIAKLVAPVLKHLYTPERIGLVVEWFEIPHAHIKLFPINASGDIGNEHVEMLNTEDMIDIQQKIISNLSI